MSLLIWAVSGATFFGFSGMLGLLFSYSPAILVIEPASPGRAPIYTAFAYFAGAGLLLALVAYAKVRSFPRHATDKTTTLADDGFAFLIGVPMSVALLVFVPPDAILVGPGDLRRVDSPYWRAFIGLWVGVFSTSMTLRAGRVYSGLLSRDEDV